MMRILTAIAAIALAVSATLAQAAERLVVVELFTSQGCSSCPPADALLGELTRRDDVLPLALHVDYWDYIGWKDSFGSPAHTERQRGYARAAGGTTIYTPQIVVGGRDHVIGFKPMKLAAEIERHGRQPEVVAIEARRSGRTVEVTLRPRSPIPGRHDIVLVRFVPSESVKIRRGENAGRTLTYHNIVREIVPIGRWDGTAAVRAKGSVSGEGEVAVLVQQSGHGAIWAAARVR